MRLLVTRSEPDAAATADRLRELGHDVLAQPLLKIVFAPAPEGLAKPAAIALTSRNAVRALTHWREAEAWRDVPVFAVGGETAERAREAGFTWVEAGAGDVAALGALIAEKCDPAAGAILYPAPRERAGDLAGWLRAAGFGVDAVEAYRAVPAVALDAAVVAAIRGGGLEGVLLFSRRTAAVFRDLIEAAGLAGALGGITLFVLSDSVASPLRDLAAADIRVAERPDAASLFALLSHDARNT